MDGERSTERLALTFSPLPQDAWAEEREVAQDEQAIEALRRWGDHLARAIRIADRLTARGWRLRLTQDSVVAEKRADRAEVEALARELKEDLHALTATAELDGEDAAYLTLESNDVQAASEGRFHPLIGG